MHISENTFKDQKVLVIGDLMVDYYINGTADRISPEAPVPIVKQESVTCFAGGAGNVACNITAAGAKCYLTGFIGADVEGAKLYDIFSEHNVEFWHVYSKNPTTCKTRVVANGQQVVRFDKEVTTPLDIDVADNLVKNVTNMLKHLEIDVVILSDYGKGIFDPGLTPQLIELAKNAGKPVYVDPKHTDYRIYSGATCITPNEKEAVQATGLTDASLAANQIRQTTGIDSVVVTLGAKGALFDADRERISIAATAKEVYDVTGAGDTFIAYYALGKAKGLGNYNALKLAIRASGVAVGKFGVKPVSFKDL